MLQMCPSCRGSKKVIRLGFVEKNCEECGGIGKIKQLEEQKKTEISFETINEGVELFRKYPEKPEEHYKITIPIGEAVPLPDNFMFPSVMKELEKPENKEFLDAEIARRKMVNEVKKDILEKPKNLKGSSSHGKDRKGK